MPSSYQAPRRMKTSTKGARSQSASTNTAQKDSTVADILSHKGGDVFSIRPHTTLHEAVLMLKEKKIGAVLVREANGDLRGILSERDIVRKLAEVSGQTLAHTAQDIMTCNVENCASNDTLLSVLQAMTEGRFRHMPVIDGTNLVGVVTIGDVVNHRLKELEHEALQLKQLIVG